MHIIWKCGQSVVILGSETNNIRANPLYAVSSTAVKQLGINKLRDKMRLNKFALLWALPLIGTIMGSCKLDEGKIEQTRSSYVSQMVIPDDASQEVSVQKGCLYVLEMDLVENSMVISSTGIKVGESTYNFQSDPMKFTSGYNAGNESYVILGNPQGMLGNERVTDIKGYLTNMVPNYYSNMQLVMSYRIPGATVKTFSPTPVFAGITTTSYPAGPTGATQTSSTDEATYGVVFSDDMKKATVVIYNIKFAPNMPKALEAVELKDLEVTLADGGYKVTGADIIPMVKEGNGGSTPYVNFPFASFELHTSDDLLTTAKCSYQVNAEIKGRKMEFHGAFEGRCADYIGRVNEEK